MSNASNSPWDSINRYGDRTSSFMTAYPGFETFHLQENPGCIRYADQGKGWVAATEPLTPAPERAAAFRAFAMAAKAAGIRAFMAPVSETLSAQLATSGSGISRFPVGMEPVFELADYFQNPDAPLRRFPIARAAKHRGATVQAFAYADMDPALVTELRSLTRRWLESRVGPPLHFLNQVNPFFEPERKKFFVLFHRGKIQAFLAAVPVPASNAYFFADYIRAEGAPSGSIELLLIESMENLWRSGIEEVRFGLCPLAGMETYGPRGIRERILTEWAHFAFRRLKAPYSFQSIYAFKAKFEPSRWERLYWVGQGAPGWAALRSLLSVQYPKGLAHAVLTRWTTPIFRALTQALRAEISARAWPQSGAEALSRAKGTLGFAAFFLALHGLRTESAIVQEWFMRSAYKPADVSWLGFWVGPLFHNNLYHLLGDVSTFVILGVVFEWLCGFRAWFGVVALGLWASNPLTHAFLASFSQVLDGTPIAASVASSIALEQDYGSSNAVYGLLGALTALVRKPFWLLMPFILNGLFLCFTKVSWLSLHHFAGLATGYCVGAWVLSRAKARARAL